MKAHHITVILVAHRLSSIARAERIVVLEGGKITEEGLYRDLSVREGSRFRSLMAAQLLLEKNRAGSSSPADQSDGEMEEKRTQSARA
jgi:ATP-binding cassette subfamily B (MDR/TAP) protein 10